MGRGSGVNPGGGVVGVRYMVGRGAGWGNGWRCRMAYMIRAHCSMIRARSSAMASLSHCMSH